MCTLHSCSLLSVVGRLAERAQDEDYDAEGENNLKEEEENDHSIMREVWPLNTLPLSPRPLCVASHLPPKALSPFFLIFHLFPRPGIL